MRFFARLTNRDVNANTQDRCVCMCRVGTARCGLNIDEGGIFASAAAAGKGGALMHLPLAYSKCIHISLATELASLSHHEGAPSLPHNTPMRSTHSLKSFRFKWGLTFFS